MARNVHWKIQFRTRSEKLGVLNLYEENYSGEVVELTPAAVPFETQEDSSDKWLEPIRKQTGYIRVLDEGNTEGIMPVGMMDRFVEYREDDVLQWCGYMVPDVFSSDWDVTPLEVEFPVIGGLGVLEGVYLNENDGLGVVPLARLMYDALKATGIDYSMIYFPKEVLQNESATDYLFPMRLEVSRFNFFQDNDSLNSEDSDWTRYNGETHYNVLSEVMRFYGWTIRERGSEIWITSTNNEGSVKISMTDLSVLAEGFAMAENESVNVSEYDLSSFGLAGADHKRDILQGRKKVVVKASVNPVGAVVPSVDKAKMRFVDTFVGNFATNNQIYAYEKRSLYVPIAGYTDVVFRSYAKTTMNEIFSDWTQIKQTMAGVTLYLGAYFIEQERVTAEEYAKKKNWNLTETIRINLQDWTGDYPTIEEARNLPIVQMKSRNVANYVSGAFVISGQTRSISQGLLTDYDGNGKGSLEIMFRVGNKYWNGSGWVSDVAWFGVQMGDEENPDNWQGTGKIISTKTLDMPYNGADGYIMPINESLSGEIELTIHAVRNDGGYGVLMLDNFKVDYFGEDLDQKKSEDSENRYAKTTGLNYTNEEEISLKMATNNNNKAGYGIVGRSGSGIRQTNEIYQFDKRNNKVLRGDVVYTDTVEGFSTSDFIPVGSAFKIMYFNTYGVQPNNYFAGFVMYNSSKDKIVYVGGGTGEVNLKDYPDAKYFRYCIENSTDISSCKVEVLEMINVELLIESMYFVGKGMMRPEINLVNKGVSLYGRNTEKLTLQLDKISARPHDVILWDGKEYQLASEAVNWAEETGQYIIMEL